jgi:amidase
MSEREEQGLSRRSFLQCSAVGALGVAVEGARGRLPSVPGALKSPAGVAASAPGGAQLEEATVAELQEGMRTGRLTARSVTEYYLGRIHQLDPKLRSVLETNPEAVSIAEALDAERKAGKVRGPLHGIPVLIKDNIDTADRMATTAGSLALMGARPKQDSHVAERLRAAGAVILGKTNLSEWANFRSSHSSSGWSGRGGQCGNPYALDRSPCGSSSGSGAAVSAGFAALAVGTETDGSIVCPSSANSVVGIKPTLGLVSRSGIVPIAHSQDTAGPMARTVADAAALLGALAGPDPRDVATAEAHGHIEADYTKYLDAGGLKGARIGVARKKLFGSSTHADRLAEEAIAAMKAAGAVIVDPADIPHLGDYDGSEFDLLLYEFKADLNAYLAALAESPVRSLADAIRFNDEHAAQELPYFGQEIFLQAQKKGPLTDPKYRAALAKNHRLSRTEGIDAVMTRHRLDALVAPTGGPPWMIDLVDGDHDVGGSSTPAAVAGYPHVTVPAGYAFGVPVGISFIGRAWSEPTLIRLAYAYEQATKLRRPPRFLETADLDRR